MTNDVKNPIIAFREKHPTISWNDMTEKTGLAKMTIWKMAHKEADRLLDISMKSHLALKDAYGIDFASWLEDYLGIKH